MRFECESENLGLDGLQLAQSKVDGHYVNVFIWLQIYTKLVKWSNNYRIQLKILKLTLSFRKADEVTSVGSHRVFKYICRFCTTHQAKSEVSLCENNFHIVPNSLITIPNDKACTIAWENRIRKCEFCLHKDSKYSKNFPTGCRTK